jgi:DNA-binding transcriptional ArsR family regulator
MNTEHDIKNTEHLALHFKALSHPARLRILHILAKRGTCICGEIVDMMPLSQATVSQHLKILKEAGLISGEVDGQKSCYCINGETISDLRKRFESLFGALENCC